MGDRGLHVIMKPYAVMQNDANFRCQHGRMLSANSTVLDLPL